MADLLGNSRVSRAFEHAPRLFINDKSNIVIMSDCHRGTGDGDDNFAGNSNTFFTALTRYYDAGFTYIELGDGDELWVNRDFGLIAEANDHIFRLLAKFRDEGRLRMIYGNHDIVKRSAKWRKNNLSTCYDEQAKCDVSLFGGMDVTEGLILTHRETKRDIYLTHGHQGDLLNDKLWRVARFLVRYAWGPLELIGVKDPTNTAASMAKRNAVEQRLTEWAKLNDAALIAGHTHRISFPKKGDPLYFNDGNCVHPRRVTAIEITRGTISLVKWAVETRDDGVLFVGKTITEGPAPLREL